MKLLEHPFFFDLFERLIGGHRGYRIFVDEYLKPEPGMSILDIGCGTCNLLEHLPSGIRYYGVDNNMAYLQHARRKYGCCLPQVNLSCLDASDLDRHATPGVDVAAMYGVLHHLTRVQASKVFDFVCGALKPGGRFLVAEPCMTFALNPAQRWLLSLDRGRYIRTLGEYESLLGWYFNVRKSDYRTDFLRIPSSMGVFECTTKK